MSKNKFQGGHAPRPTKGLLTSLASKQVTNDESVKAPAQEESTVSTAPAPQAEATPAPAAAKPKDTGLYRLGKKYAPKTDRNSETWGKLTKALTEGPKSMKELSELVKGHGDFLGYMTRGGHIVPHVEEAPKAEATA